MRQVVLAVSLVSTLTTTLNGCSFNASQHRAGLLPLLSTPSIGQSVSAVDNAVTLSAEEVEFLLSLDSSGQLKGLAEQALVRDQADQAIVDRVEQARVLFSTQPEKFESDFFTAVQALPSPLRRRYLSSQAGILAQRKALLVEIARAYLLARACAFREQTATGVLQHRIDQIDLTRGQFLNGTLLRDDLHQSMVFLTQARLQSESARQRRIDAFKALHLLTGREPKGLALPFLLSGSHQPHPAWLSDLPSDRLLDRFDIQAAEKLLVTDHTAISVARASFFPSIRLSTSDGLASDNVHALFSNSSTTWSFAPRQPLGSQSGTGRATSLNQRTSISNYQKVIQRAFKDMADALAERHALLQRIRSQSVLGELARGQLKDRLVQASDAISKLDKLAASIQVLQTDQALGDTQLAIELNLLSLYKVLYGADASAIPS
ncbi:TolC family protein [Pseudomonas sp. NPDC008258]|uniref:TolC family protein n=1 Tax=Pseudomonas sp. NPDC008258 TaxID=3364418 RepID=UPI0036EB960B